MLSKQELREWAKKERKNLDIKNISYVLVRKLQETDEYKIAKHIMIFYPLKEEINLLDLLKDQSKKFYLPKIDGKSLLCCPYDGSEDLCESYFKTKEPLTDPVEKSLIDLIIVPALAVDKNNYRLGYGGGFYDRFLSDSDVVKISCVPKAFVLETIYPNDYDIKIDKVLTE